MTVWAIPVDELPRQEDLPPELVCAGGDPRQFGHRLVDRDLGDVGRITAGSWRSGVFATEPFLFAGCEWLFVVDGQLQLDVDGDRHEIMPGMAALVPKGLRCRWIQPFPVLKLFLRWDYEGGEQPSAFWHSAMGGPPPVGARFIAERERARWENAGSRLVLDAGLRNLTLAGTFDALQRSLQRGSERAP